MTYQQAVQPPAARSVFFYGNIIVIAAFFIMVVATGVHYAFGVFFTPILTEFGWTRAVISGAFSISWIVQGLLGVLMGGINDRLGPRIVLTVCAVLFGLGYLLTSQIDSIWQLYLFYGVMVGTAQGGIYIPLTSTIARWFTRKRNTMTGIMLAGMGVGTLIMPIVINQFISSYDWRVSCIIVGGIIFIVMLLAAQFMKRDPSKIGLLPYGESEKAAQDVKINIQGFSTGNAVRTRQFWQTAGIFLCSACCVFAIMAHIVPHAIDIGISAGVAAGLISTIGAGSVIGKVMFGSIADRIGNKWIYVICFTLALASLLWLLSTRETWMFYLFAAVFGLAYGGFSVSMSPLIAALFGIRSHGLISGLANNGFTLGAAIGPIVAGFIFDITGGYTISFSVLAAVSIIGLILALFLTPTRVEKGKI